MDREKFQQKVLRQAKQKKSKSAEFLMVKEETGAAEGVGNPAFHTSSPDLSAHQTPAKKVIRHGVLALSLAAHRRNPGRLASAESKAPLHVDKRRFCADRLRRPLGESGYTEARDESSEKVPSGPAEPRGSSESLDCRKEDSDPTSASREAFERYTQEGVIWLGNSPLKQDLKFEGEELSQHIPMSCLGTDKTFGKSVSSGSPRRSLLEDLHICKEDSRAKPGTVTEGAPGPRQKALQVEMECVRGLKNKTPPGSYLLSVSLLRQLGGCAVQRWQPDHLKTRTHPVRHDGNFYDVGLYFHEHLYVVPPPTKDVKPGMAFLFELVLLRGKDAVLDRVVGWSAFPLCDNNLDVVEGKFKCPLLRGHYDQRLDTFRKIEDLICLDLDHWLCNLYFQVTKVPPCLDDHRAHAVHTQRPIGFPVCLMAETEKAESGMENTAGLSGEGDERNLCALVGGEVKSSLPSPHGSIFNKTGPCPVDCDLDLLEEDQELHHQGERWIDHPVKDIPVARRTGVMKGYTQDVSYLEKLQKHRISVCCPPVAGRPGPGEFFRHLRLAQVSLSSELQLAQWRSQGFWYVILLLASVGVLRLHLHYLGQWLYLQATSAPVTEFRFSALTVELCYPASALHIREELLVVVAGPLLLNAAMIPLVLIRWGCRLLCASCPDVLSKLIVTMGLWTVLDPLAVFAVDAVLGRLTPTGEMPTADVAKLYWAFARTGQSGLVGAALTALIYALLFVISSSTLYLCGLRLHNDSWILDAFQRVHSEEAKFFMPYDLEISNQELSHIVKRSEQWRGINGERRKVAVYDYVWKSHGVTSGTPSGDLQHGNQVPESARGPGDVTSHVSIYTTHPSGFRELFRHFLRLPGGAIIEVFDVISGFQLLPGEVATAIQEHLSELDSTLRDTFQLPSKDRERIPSNEKELAAAMQSRVS